MLLVRVMHSRTQPDELQLVIGKQETDAIRLNTAQLTDITRFRNLRRLHLAHVDKDYSHIASAVLVTLEALQHLQVRQVPVYCSHKKTDCPL